MRDILVMAELPLGKRALQPHRRKNPRLGLLLLLTGLTFALSSCSSERADVRRYLAGLDKDVMPAIEQAKVIGEVGKTVNALNFKATWPVLRKDIVEMQGKLKAGQDDVKELKVPPACNNLSQLVHDEMDLLSQLCDKGQVLGDQVSNLGDHPLQRLKEMRPQIEEWQQLGARQVEMKAKLENEISDLKRKEKL